MHIHCSRSGAQAIFADELKGMHARKGGAEGYRLHFQHSAERGRLQPSDLDQLCPDWREREAFVCGPPGLLDALKARFERDGDLRRLHHEHFQPDAALGEGRHGAGGTIRFCASGLEAASDGSQPILAAGEQAGAELPFGCRMGICHSCIGRLRSGRVRDLRTGRVHGAQGEVVQTCVNAPEGPIEIDL
jgi:ferredoxin